jgi:hypothetical protein
MNNRARLAMAATTGLALALTLTACGSSSSSTASTSSAAASTAAASPAASSAASPSVVGGMTTCDNDTISKAVTALLANSSNGMKLDKIEALNCSDGWAAPAVTVSNAEGQGAMTETLIFQAEGQFWVPKDANAVCGTPGSDTTVRPSDAQVPADIWTMACTTN